jgi:hypothetical protein
MSRRVAANPGFTKVSVSETFVFLGSTGSFAATTLLKRSTV